MKLMVLCDVNIYLYAFRTDADDHQAYRDWLNELIAKDEPFGYSELVLSAFLRIVTHRRVFKPPTPLPDAITFAQSIRNQPNSVPIRPHEQHWSIFLRLCEETNATGGLIPDAYFAALAIGSGCKWVTTDRDYALFSGLDWMHPLGSGV